MKINSNLFTSLENQEEGYFYMRFHTKTTNLKEYIYLPKFVIIVL